MELTSRGETTALNIRSTSPVDDQEPSMYWQRRMRESPWNNVVGVDSASNGGDGRNPPRTLLFERPVRKAVKFTALLIRELWGGLGFGASTYSLGSSQHPD